jgi:hypothetical protein
VPPEPPAAFADRLLDSAAAILRAFVFPDLGLSIPAGLLTGLLVGGVILLVLGSLSALLGRGRGWLVVSAAAAAGAAAWVLHGHRHQVAASFVVVQLVLAFAGGATFVLGFFRSPWVPGGLLLAVLLAAGRVVDARLLGALLALVASILGAWSLYRRFEEWSPGRRGSRWNRRSAAGWVLCLLASGALEAPGLASWGPAVKAAGMAAGAAALILLPRRRRGRPQPGK